MPNKKTQTNHSTKNSPIKRPRLAALAPSRMPKTMKMLILPGAALIGSGLVATAGVLMREQLERMLRAALKSALAGGVSARKAAEQLSMEKLLAHVGVPTRRRSAPAMALGAFAGVIAGAAITAWLAPMVKKQLESRREPAMVSKEPMTSNSLHVEPSV